MKITNLNFENSFPLLTWQFPFTCAIVCGFRYDTLAIWVRTKQGRVARALILILFFVFLFFTWNNYWINELYKFVPRLQIIKQESFYFIYSTFFKERTWMAAGRLLNAFIIVGALFEILAIAWTFFRKWVGWWVLPIGQASLYVFIMHLALIPVVILTSHSFHRRFAIQYRCSFA